tara:strand:- start:230 stop:430 length:201 start_codon:yes stop_codon:yes gene_type:complete
MKNLVGTKVKAFGVKGKTIVTKVDSYGNPIEGTNNDIVIDLVETGFRFYGLLKIILTILQNLFKGH